MDVSVVISSKNLCEGLVYCNKACIMRAPAPVTLKRLLHSCFAISLPFCPSSWQPCFQLHTPPLSLALLRPLLLSCMEKASQNEPATSFSTVPAALRTPP